MDENGTNYLLPRQPKVAIDAGNYVGREQAYVKHHFLADYLEKLIFKIASVYNEIIYIDGFSGPWQHKGERFQDTSFGIALQTLRSAKQAWATMKNPALQRQVNMTAHLVEKDQKAFSKLGDLQGMFPDIHVVCHNKDFTEFAPSLASTLPSSAFTFIFIDPKGWKIDLRAIAPMISRDNCEVVFNFMFDFINRFALSTDETISQQLDRLIPGRNWRARIRAIDSEEQSGSTAASRAANARRRVLAEEFRDALREVGKYKYVADIGILRPDKDRTLYFLAYGTRRPEGIQVFRDCHVSSLEAQSDIRGRTKLEGIAKKSNQFELLASTNEMGPDKSMISLPTEAKRATMMMRDLAPISGRGVRWDAIWPEVLSRCVIRLTDLKKIANDERKAGTLIFPDWPRTTKRVPDDHYLVKRGIIETGDLRA